MALFRLTLWVLPFRHSLALARSAARWRRSDSPEATGADLEAALQDVSRFVPRASCLPRALGVAVTLGRGGGATELLLGLPEGPRAARFASHAWVEIDQQPVFGVAARPHHELARIPIATLGAAKRPG